MTPEEYQNKMKAHQEQFDKLWEEMVKDTNDFLKDNPEKTMYSLITVEAFADDLAVSGAWVHDRINGLNPRTDGKMTPLIRKALGFTYL